MDNWTQTLRRVVLVANRKGGVCKSSLCRSVASVLESGGYSVLVVDGDPQGNVSEIDFGLETDRGRSLAMAMQYGTDLSPESVRGIDVICGGPELQGALGAAGIPGSGVTCGVRSGDYARTASTTWSSSTPARGTQCCLMPT